MRAAATTAALLLVVYLLTLAPGVTFWDAGEFIAAAHGLGIPHPPGTPLYVALGRAWIVAVHAVAGSARAMNALSAMCTALAGGLATWTIARATQGARDGAWGAAAAGLLAGLMCSAWSNATETEVYALALLHVALMLGCALRAEDGPRGTRWVVLAAYLIGLAPAIHLSALVGAPAVIAIAARRRDGSWSGTRALALAGSLVASAGVGRLSALLAVGGLAMQGAAVWLASRDDDEHVPASILLTVPLAATALLLLLVRARHDPALNQGAPVTLAALADVVGRRQYAVAGLLPRQAPAWLQLANIAQYTDWQVAMSWGHGVFTTPARVAATLAYLALAVAGWRDLRRSAPRLATGIALLVAGGTLGVATYLNMKAGASLGWGMAGIAQHEARERDYFFVLGFWGWALAAGWGALLLARRTRHSWLALGVALVPLVANWPAVDRAHDDDAGAARRLAFQLLRGAPPGAILFSSGDNDSYPLWYLQQVEDTRPDVQLVTVPLLPAGWYAAEIARRTGWRWDATEPAPGAMWRHEQTAAAIARAAWAAHRPVAASPALSARERALLGSDWTLRGPLYVAGGPPTGAVRPPMVDSAAAWAWVAARPPMRAQPRRMPDDVTGEMLELLECPRLGVAWQGTRGARTRLK